MPSIRQEVLKTRSHLGKLFKGLKTIKTNSGPSKGRAEILVVMHDRLPSVATYDAFTTKKTIVSKKANDKDK